LAQHSRSIKLSDRKKGVSPKKGCWGGKIAGAKGSMTTGGIQGSEGADHAQLPMEFRVVCPGAHVKKEKNRAKKKKEKGGKKAKGPQAIRDPNMLKDPPQFEPRSKGQRGKKRQIRKIGSWPAAAVHLGAQWKEEKEKSGKRKKSKSQKKKKKAMQNEGKSRGGNTKKRLA